MKKAILLIDGENFQYKIEQVLEKAGEDKKVLATGKVRLGKLVNKVFSEYTDIEIIEKRYYSAKLHLYKETLKKSKQLIATQRSLKINLERQGFKFISAGHVRAQFVKTDGKSKPIFKEKGVDVKIAVDMVSMACDKKVDTIILCSSDSDLQPAVKEDGLTFTTNNTILFRNPEILEAVL